MTHKPLKVAAGKTLFSSVYVIGTSCFNEMFFYATNLQEKTHAEVRFQ